MKLNHYKHISILLSVFIIGTALSYNNKTYARISNDCGTIITVSNNKFEEIFPPEAIDKAIKNLDAYCCKQNELTGDRCKNPPTQYPASPFLFDHLVDVGLRRLDAINTYDLAPDPTGAARKKEIKKIGEDSKGNLPSATLKLYEKYRTLKPENILGTIHHKIANFNAKENGTLENYLKNYNTLSDPLLVTLADKYNNLCLIARNLYETKPGEKIIIGSDGADNNSSYYNKCQTLVKSKIKQENLYTKTIFIQKGNKLLIDNINKLTMVQFVQDRLIKLQDKIKEIVNLFTIIVKQAAVCKKCSQ